MRKLLGIVILGLFLSGNAYGKVGKGNLQMSEDVLKYFIEYLRNEYATSFIISGDGKFATFGICGAKVCSGGSGGTSTLLKYCKKETGSKCFIYAQRKKMQKIIRWNKIDYIFPKGDWRYNEMVKAEHLKSDNEGIKKNITDNDILNTLNKLGFISKNIEIKEIKKEATSSTSTVKKKVKKQKKEKVLSSEVSQKIKQIEEMYELGALTKEEFEAAKRRALEQN